MAFKTDKTLISLIVLIGIILIIFSIYPKSFESYKEKARENQSQATKDVPRKDGTFESRPNDLEELCKDWFFYRKKIIEAKAIGDMEAIKKYQISFRQVNAWLNEYRPEDVNTMMTKAEANSKQ